MNILWDISDNDIQKLLKVVEENENPFLIKRRERNVNRQNIVIDKNTIIKAMGACLLTSQQRSGPNSLIGKFLQKEPFPLMIGSIGQITSPEDYIKRILKENGLTRYINRISEFYATNLDKIQIENWNIIDRPPHNKPALAINPGKEAI